MPSALPLPVWPGVPLLTPPASMAMAASSAAMGVSLRPWMITVKVAVTTLPLPSLTLYWNTSVSWSALVRRACTALLLLSTT
ncbi:hypothetical protein D3C76_862200 [compost metagenome]